VHRTRPARVGTRPRGQPPDRSGVDRYDAPVAVRQSAGILLFRRPPGRAPELLLAHPGGPFFAKRDEGHWSIPKGEPDLAETDLLAVARREFAEETGHPSPDGLADGSPPIELGTITQKGGKIVHAWAVEGDLDPAVAVSNEFEMEWPPRSGLRERFPECEQARWMTLAEARTMMLPSQLPLLDALEQKLKG